MRRHVSVAGLIAVALVACSDSSDNNGQIPAGTGAYAAAAQQCVDRINQLRAQVGAAALARADDKEGCTDSEAQSDAQSGKPHGAFPSCGESTQNECPGWPGTPDSVATSCVDAFFAEGPGDYAQHGHYINMTSTTCTRASCGFYDAGGRITMVVNFY